MIRLFTTHPATVGETYLQHLGMAWQFGGKMVLCGIACLLHGLFPFLFTQTGSRAIERLHSSMVETRGQRG